MLPYTVIVVQDNGHAFSKGAWNYAAADSRAGEYLADPSVLGVWIVDNDATGR